MSLSEGEERTGFLASYSPLFGVGAFAFLKLPEPWALRMVPEPPECDLLGAQSPRGGFRWVVKGRLKALLVNEEVEESTYLLKVETRVFSKASDAEKFLVKRFRKLEEKSGSKVVEKGIVTVSGHEASYMVLISREKPIFGRERTKYLIEMAFFCDKTRRLLWIEVMGGPKLLEDAKTLVLIISSLSCHG